MSNSSKFPFSGQSFTVSLEKTANSENLKVTNGSGHILLEQHEYKDDFGDGVKVVRVGRGVKTLAAKMGVPNCAKDMQRLKFYQSAYYRDGIQPIIAAAERAGLGKAQGNVKVERALHLA